MRDAGHEGGEEGLHQGASEMRSFSCIPKLLYNKNEVARLVTDREVCHGISICRFGGTFTFMKRNGFPFVSQPYYVLSLTHLQPITSEANVELLSLQACNSLA